MADPVNFARVTELPAVALIDTVYFVQPTLDAPVRQFVTGNDGVPVEIAAASAADQLFDAGLIAEPTPAAMAAYLVGPAGPPPTVAVNPVVQSVPNGTPGSVSISGPPEAPELSFVLPAGPQGPTIPKTAVSAGSVDAGKAAALTAEGIIDPSLLTQDGNVKLPAIVAGGGEIIIPVGDPGSPPALLSSTHTFQPSDVAKCGHTSWKYGADNKAYLEHVIKLNGPVGDYAAVAAGSRVSFRLIQAATGTQTGHVGAETWAVDGALKGSAGEVPGLFQIITGTGWAAGNTPDPTYFGTASAVKCNRLQQTFFPGQNYARKVITGTLAPTGVQQAQGSDFGACLVLPAGGSVAGRGAVKFDYPNAELLAVPEIGILESDATGQVFYTDPQAQRGPIHTDRILSCVLAMASLPGASGTIVNGPNCAIVTVTTGPTDQTAGNTFRVNFALASGATMAFPNGVVPQVTPRDAATAAWAVANQLYASVPAARTGIIIGVPNLKVWPANSTFVFNVSYQGW